MTTAEMIALCRQRTRIADTTKILLELQSAYQWASRRVFNSADGPDLLATIGEELSALGSTTRSADLATLVANDMLAIKQLWVKLPGDTRFVEMVSADAGDPFFKAFDSSTAANPDIATAHPVLYDIINVTTARFAPALPSGAVIRVDYFSNTVEPDESDSSASSPADSMTLPSVFHDAVVDKATAQLFTGLDDTREATYETRARENINDAIFVAQRRVQAPTRTQPYRRR